MMNNSFSTSFTVDAEPRRVFDAVANVSGWWTENIVGNSKNLGDEFEVRFDDVHYSKQRLIEVVPNERIAWLVTDSRLTFVENMSEWTDTKIVFDITTKGTQTELRFAHQGLTPEFECFDACSTAWSDYVKSLFKLVKEGKGTPDPKIKAKKQSVA